MLLSVDVKIVKCLHGQIEWFPRGGLCPHVTKAPQSRVQCGFWILHSRTLFRLQYNPLLDCFPGHLMVA